MEKIELGKLILIFIGMFIAMIGTILIYNSRIITKKIFSFADQNDGVFILKVTGFTISIIGGIIIIFN